MRDRLVLDGYMTELLNDRRYQDERQAILPQFPRPKKDEPGSLARGLNALSLMKRIGPILAPEVVNWDVSGFSLGRSNSVYFSAVCHSLNYLFPSFLSTVKYLDRSP